MLGICGNLVEATVTLEAAVELCLECRSVPPLPPPVDGASEPPVTAAEPLFDAECIELDPWRHFECPFLPLAMDHANLENGVGARPIIISRLPNRLVPETFDTACP